MRDWFYQNRLSFVDQASPSPAGARRGRWSWWVTGIVLVLGWTAVDFVGMYVLCEMAETDEAVEAISYAGGQLLAAGFVPISLIVLVVFLGRERR
jgi:hypothetical protein